MFFRVSILFALAAAVAFAGGSAEANEAPSTFKLPCEPSADCALRMAQRWGMAGDPVEYLFTLGRVLPAVARHGSRAELDRWLKVWSDQFAVVHGSREEVPIAAAQALAIAGRADEAIFRAKASSDAELRRASMIRVAAELALMGNVEKAAAAWNQLDASDGRESGRISLLLEIIGRNDQVVSGLAAQIGFDVNDPKSEAAPLVAMADIRLGHFEKARQYASRSGNAARWFQEIALAQIERGQLADARESLRAAAEGLRDVEDKDERHLLSLRIAQGFIAAGAPRDALPMVRLIYPDARPELLASVAEALAWTDLAAARSVAAQIKPRDSWQGQLALQAIAAAEIALDPMARKALMAIESPRSRGRALARAAEKIAGSQSAAVKPLLEEAIAQTADDLDVDGRNMSWKELALTMARLGFFDQAYQSAERISASGARTHAISELALVQSKAGQTQAARERLGTTLRRERAATQSPSVLAGAAQLATEAGFLDVAFEALHGLKSGKDGRGPTNEPELHEAKMATALALARSGALTQAFALVDSGYRGDEILVSLYEALASQPTVSLPKQ